MTPGQEVDGAHPYDTGRLRGNIRKCAAVRLFFWMHLFASIIVPFFQEWGGLSYTEILLIQAWFMVCNFLLEVPTGAVADRFGRKYSMALAGVVVAVATPVYASVPRLPVFLAGEILFAAAMTLASGADEALIYDSLKALGRDSEATRTMSMLESWKLGGVIVGALSGGLIAGILGLRAPLFLQCIPALISTVLALTLVEPPVPQTETGPVARKPYLTLISGGLGHLRRHRILRSLTLDMVSAGTLAWLILWSYPPQLKRAGIPIAAYGVVHSFMCIGQILLLSHQHRIERIAGGITPLLRVTAILPALGYLALAAASGPVASVTGILAVSVFGLSRGPLFSGAVNRHISSGERATVLSAISAARTLAIGLVYPVAGVLMDRSLNLAFAAFGASGLLVTWLAAAPRAATEYEPAETPN
jgi:MFS family permease